MSPQPASFALERFAVTPVTADTVLLELQGVLDGAPPRSVPQLLVEDALRTRREHAPIEPLPAEPRLRATFAVPATDIETATFSLVVGGLLLELPSPDPTPGADRTVTLARELNGARRGLAQARHVVAQARERDAAHAMELAAVREAAEVAADERAAAAEQHAQAAAAESAGRVRELEDAAAELETERDDALRAAVAIEAERDAAREEARRATEAAQAERAAREEQERAAPLEGEAPGLRARAVAGPLDVADTPPDPAAPVTAESTLPVAVEVPPLDAPVPPEGDPSPDDDEAPPITVARPEHELPEDTGPIPLRRASERRYTPRTERAADASRGAVRTPARVRPRASILLPSPDAERLPTSQAPRGLVLGVVAVASFLVLLALVGYVL